MTVCVPTSLRTKTVKSDPPTVLCVWGKADGSKKGCVGSPFLFVSVY